MNIKTTTLHTIHTTEEKLKRNLYSSYTDILTDGLKEDTVEYFEDDAHRLSEVIQTVDKHGFASLFKDGFTMMLLDAEDFKFLEKWHFHDKDETENLQVVITKKNGQIEIVSQENLYY